MTDRRNPLGLYRTLDAARVANWKVAIMAEDWKAKLIKQAEDDLTVIMEDINRNKAFVQSRNAEIDALRRRLADRQAYVNWLRSCPDVKPS